MHARNLATPSRGCLGPAGCSLETASEEARGLQPGRECGAVHLLTEAGAPGGKAGGTLRDLPGLPSALTLGFGSRWRNL